MKKHTAIRRRRISSGQMFRRRITQKDTTYKMYSLNVLRPIPVAERSKALAWGRSLTGIAGSNPAEGMDVCLCARVVCCQVRGLRDGPITRPQESYGMCVCV